MLRLPRLYPSRQALPRAATPGHRAICASSRSLWFLLPSIAHQRRHDRVHVPITTTSHITSDSSPMPETRSTAPLVWIDCEMTGLSPEKDTILSISCFLTDYKLDLIETDGYHAVVKHSLVDLQAMGEWCTNTHQQSGLWDQALASRTSHAEAADGLSAFVQKHVPEKGVALLAGNSVHADRAFLAKEPWSQVLGHLSYRLLDVSSVKEAARRWAPDDVLAGVPRKQGKHTAREDILESIEEMKYYRRVFFDTNAR